MQNHPRSRWLLLLIGLAMGCNAADRPPLAVGRIHGRVVFVGPVPEAPVRIVRWLDGRPAGQVAEGQTDADGRFSLPGLRLDAGTYRLHVDVGDTAWASAGRTGRHPAGLTLSATLDHARFAEQAIAITPLTTLADAAADGLAAAGRPDPNGRARVGLTAHVGFDPVFTAIGDPLADLASEPALHRLVVDGVAALGDQLGARAGLSPGTIAPAAVLTALLADARGPEPAGWFDGVGVEGPVMVRPDLPLDPDALRHELAAVVQALVERDGAWAGVTPQALAPLIKRLSCSPSSLFPACDPAALDDVTPPVIDAIEPAPGTPLAGVVDVTVRAHDPDGALARVKLTVRLPNRQLALPALPGPGFVFRVDTGTIQGTAWLDVEVEAINAAGLRTARSARWPLAHREEGVLSGWVHKGPAHYVRVRAYDLADPPQLLAHGTTDGEGAFALAIVGYVGPVRLEASDDLAAGEDQPSAFDDEVRGWTRWGSGLTLSGLVPEFRSTAPPEPVVITPLTDLALAKARYAEAQGALLVGAYEQALAQLGDLFDLPADPHVLLHLRPAGLARPFAALSDPERLALALGCLSEQADGLAPKANPGLFTALDLLALYRADVRADGLLDGREGQRRPRVSTAEGPVELGPDPLRAQLPQACARWLGHPRSSVSAVRSEAVRWIHRLAAHEGAGLVDPDVEPPPFDDVGPALEASALIDDEADESRVHQRDLPLLADAEAPGFEPSEMTVVRGTIVLRVQASDLAGVAAVEAELEGVADPTALQPVEGPAAAGSGQQVTYFRVATDALPERVHRLWVTAEDQLGNRRQARFGFRVDRTPPALQVRFPADPQRPEGDEMAQRTADGWYTRHDELTGLVTASDHSPYTLTATFQIATPIEVEALGGVTTEPLDLALADFQEGRYPLIMEAVDVLGHRTAIGDALWVDRTPPTVAVIPSECPDEAHLPADGDPEGVPTLPLDAAGGTVRLWQTTWARNERPIGCWAHFGVGDAVGEVEAPPGSVALSARGCLVDPALPAGPCQPGTERAWSLTGGATRLLPFTTGPAMMPFDPVEPEDTAHTFALREVVATDLAGNQTVLEAPPVYTLEVVAPTLTVRFEDPAPGLVLPEGVVDLRSLDYAQSEVASLLDRREAGRPDLLIGRVLVDNPHPIPVLARVSLSEPAWRLESHVAHVLYEAEPYDGAVVDPLECALDGPRLGSAAKRLVAIDEDCRLTGDGLRCSACLPAPGEGLDLPLRRARMHGGDQAVPEGADVDGAHTWPLWLEPGQARQVTLALEVPRDLPTSDLHIMRGQEPETGAAHAELVTRFGLEHRQDLIPERSGWYTGPLLRALTQVALRTPSRALVRVASQFEDHLTGVYEHRLPQRLVHPNPTLNGARP